ncbi:MAG: hypothetical protein PHR50_15010 [Lachnospiraceae bacterium]|nr:hypothetical protein [Lachnospiraceae bacterium]
MTIKELKIKFKELEQLEKRCDKAEREYELDPENELKEINFDFLYWEEYTLFDSICKEIANLIKVDYKVVRLLVSTKRKELISILERCA